MGTRHTPGPWATNRFGTQVLTGDSWNTICEIYIGKDHRFASWEDGRAATTQDANARLIAAAPDLLEALTEILVTEPAVKGAVYERAMAAIAKATQP